MNGVLYVVATPIGNLEDITLRAIKILKEADYVLCEDKRITSRLLNKYEIKTKLIGFHKFNENRILDNVLSLLTFGKNVALVSDAGTPLVSDPGSVLVSAARKNYINIVCIPGPSSLSSVLSICPFNFQEFLFLGFLPDDKSKRKKIFVSLSQRSKIVILFIAPHDLNKYLNELYDFYPEIEIFYAREVTKIYEESWVGKITELLKLSEEKKLKGEIVLVLNFGSTSLNNSVSDNEIIDLTKSYVKKGYSLKEASKAVAKEFNLSSKKPYNLYLTLKTKN